MIEVYKKKYQTCLEMLQEFRNERQDLRDAVLSYNGILDPMAEGIVTVLVGSDENKNRDRFTGSEKVYEVGILSGVSTDSGDLLGVVKDPVEIAVDEQKLINTIISSAGKFEQTVPMHSNRKVDGKRLWWWILNGVEIPKAKRPVNTVEIKEISFRAKEIINAESLRNEITGMENNMGERFRLQRVADSWKNYLEKTRTPSYAVFIFEMHVTSGFYVRAFVEDISEKLGVPLVVYSLKRTRIIHSSGN